MESVKQVQFLDKAFCVSLHLNGREKGIHKFISSSLAMGKELERFSSLNCVGNPSKIHIRGC